MDKSVFEKAGNSLRKAIIFLKENQNEILNAESDGARRLKKINILHKFEIMFLCDVYSKFLVKIICVKYLKFWLGLYVVTRIRKC